MKDIQAKAAIAALAAGLIYVGFYLGDRSAEPTRQIMASLSTKAANGQVVIDHCADSKKENK